MSHPAGPTPVPTGIPEAAAHSLARWAADDAPGAPRLCVVAGGPGSGKSALLAWLLARSAAGQGPDIHALGLAEGQTVRTLCWQLGRHLGYGPLDPPALLERLAADPRQVLLLLADLHRAGHRATQSTAGPRTVVDERSGRCWRCRRSAPWWRRTAWTCWAGPLACRRDAPRGPAAAPRAAAARVAPAARAAAAAHAAAAGVRDAFRTGVSRARQRLVPGDGRGLPGRAGPGPGRGQAPGRAAALLADPGYLIHGPVTAITAATADPSLHMPGRLRQVWQQAAPALSEPGCRSAPARRLLHAVALGQDPRLADFLAIPAGRHHWTRVGRSPARPPPHSRCGPRRRPPPRRCRWSVPTSWADSPNATPATRRRSAAWTPNGSRTSRAWPHSARTGCCCWTGTVCSTPSRDRQPRGRCSAAARRRPADAASPCLAAGPGTVQGGRGGCGQPPCGGRGRRRVPPSVAAVRRRRAGRRAGCRGRRRPAGPQPADARARSPRWPAWTCPVPPPWW
ncbi:ATP-binding protein [Streptacidiphilus sp. 4-A2]|nr:ATP-binding protein [Streptacidiphilus sp. 4-A2]